MKLKKVLAATLAGTMVMASVSTAFAATSLDDVNATGWWVDHTASVEIAEGTTVTFTFTNTTNSDAGDQWDAPIYVVYTADEAFAGGADLSSTSGYTEYFVGRADAYGWDSADGNTNAGLNLGSFSIDSTVDDFTAWLSELMNGVNCTLTASMSNSVLTVVFEVNGVKSTYTYTTDGSTIYISLSGEECTLTNISYEVETSTTSSTTTTTTTDTTTSETTTDSTTGTGDAAPIAAVAVALLGCAAIAFASKKKMA